LYKNKCGQLGSNSLEDEMQLRKVPKSYRAELTHGVRVRVFEVAKSKKEKKTPAPTPAPTSQSLSFQAEGEGFGHYTGRAKGDGWSANVTDSANHMLY